MEDEKGLDSKVVISPIDVAGRIRILNMDVLVIDVGGSHVKMRTSTGSEVRGFDSGPRLTARRFVQDVNEAVRGWHYDVISLGFPGAVDRLGPVAEPGNLGGGWVGFDFDHALADRFDLSMTR